MPETGASSRPQRRCRGEERRGHWGPGPQVLPQASAGPGARPPGPAVTPAGERSSPRPARGAVVWAGWPWPRSEQGQQGSQAWLWREALPCTEHLVLCQASRGGPARAPAGLASRGPRRALPAGGAGSVSSHRSASDVHHSGTETVRAPGHWCAVRSLEKPTPGRGLTCQAAVRGGCPRDRRWEAGPPDEPSPLLRAGGSRGGSWPPVGPGGRAGPLGRARRRACLCQLRPMSCGRWGQPAPQEGEVPAAEGEQPGGRTSGCRPAGGPGLVSACLQ